MPYPSKKFRQNPFTTVSVIRRTDKQTEVKTLPHSLVEEIIDIHFYKLQNTSLLSFVGSSSSNLSNDAVGCRWKERLVWWWWWWWRCLYSAAEVTEAASPCATSDSTVTITSSSITAVDEQTDQHHQQQQQQDSVDDAAENSPQITSPTESEDQFSEADMNHSSPSQDNVEKSIAELPAGIRLFYTLFLLGPTIDSVVTYVN